MSDKMMLLTPDEQDAIGEVMNMTMGAAATAVSTMLEKQVIITTPQLEQEMFKDIDCSELEPAIIVKISYVQGIDGNNVIMLRRHDMQVILDLLMGNEFGESDDFDFDEMSMSAACEVMNQMMGASATAMSEILDRPVNISTPVAQLVETSDEIQEAFIEIKGDDPVVSISFKMTIKDVLDTTFRSLMPLKLAREIVDTISGESEPPPAPVPEPASGINKTVNQDEIAKMFEASSIGSVPNSQAGYQPSAQLPANQQMGGQPQMGMQPQMGGQPQMGMDAQMMQQQMQMMMQQMMQQSQQTQGGGSVVNVKNSEFPNFTQQNLMANSPYMSNMGLLMGIQLEVSVVIGRTKRKIKEVMDFGQGSVILLETQTGAPAEIVVNGKLIAYGDVVVVGDNFGIRVTEIVGTKELMDSLSSN